MFDTEYRKQNMVESGYRLWGHGELEDYGEYSLAVADSKEMAYKILSENGFNSWKKKIYWNKENSHFDKDGNPLNGCADKTLEYEAKGFFTMTDEELFNYYKNLFTIDEVVDLQTNLWVDEHC